MAPLDVFEEDSGVESLRELRAERFGPPAARGDARERIGEFEDLAGFGAARYGTDARASFAKRPGMLLTLHLVVGILVIVVTALSIASRPGRRVALYLITLQVILGIVLIVQGLRAPSLHYGMALLGLAGLMAGNRLARKGGRTPAFVVTILSAACLIVAFFVGYSTLKPA